MNGKHQHRGKAGNDRNNMNRRRDGDRRNDVNRRNDEKRNNNQRNSKDAGAGKGAFRYRNRTPVRGNENREEKYSFKTKSFEEETVEDVQADIIRIQKEISLEIREIKSLKL